eukprot:gene8347-10252_t
MTYKALLTFAFLGASVSQCLFDSIVLAVGLRYPQNQDVQSERNSKRKIIAISIPIVNLIGFSTSFYWSNFLLGLNPKIYTLLMVIHGLSMFNATFGYLFNIRAFYRYFTTGQSRFGTGVIDELAEDSVEAVMDYARFHTLIMGSLVMEDKWI